MDVYCWELLLLFFVGLPAEKIPLTSVLQCTAIVIHERKEGMNKTAVMSARVSPELKARTEKLFTSLGLTVSEAFNLFLNQADLRQGLPFAVKIPNAETLKAIEEGRNGIDLQDFADAKSLMDSLRE